MAVAEAACAGLLVVSTSVGGVPEVLPPDMVELAPCRPDALLAAFGRAIGESGWDGMGCTWVGCR